MTGSRGEAEARGRLVALIVSRALWPVIRGESSTELESGALVSWKARSDGSRYLAVARSSGATLPHELRTEAMFAELADIGVRDVMTTAVCGALRPDLGVPSMMVVDQFIDMHKAWLPQVPGQTSGSRFQDVTEPYCARLRSQLLRAARAHAGVPVSPVGCYVGVDGPRYETRAEVQAFHRLGGDVVGMTAVREAIAARMNGICLGTLGFVVNYGAGVNGARVDGREIQDGAARLAAEVQAVLQATASAPGTGLCGTCDRPSS